MWGVEWRVSSVGFRVEGVGFTVCEVQDAERIFVSLVWGLGFRTQSKVVAKLTSLVPIEVAHRSSEPLYR